MPGVTIFSHPILMVAIVAAGMLSACGTDDNGQGTLGNTASIVCVSGTLTGAGSTAQQNAISQWNKAYLGKCAAANVNYQGTGSGAGVQQFQQGTIDFAGSDYPLSPADRPGADARCGPGNTAIDIPLVPGPIALGYNIPGVGPGLNLSASALAGIFTGKISRWNDPAIVSENPGVHLPDLGIQTFHRADGSGTSYNFSNYLAHEASADFGFRADETWPAPGGQGSKGTQGIAQGVTTTPGGIGYMELSYARDSHIPYARIGNTTGKFVPLTTATVQNFVAASAITGKGADLTLSFNYADTDADAYPGVLMTYEIVCRTGNRPGTLPLLKDYFGYAAGRDGQGLLESQGYVPLPESLRTKVAATIDLLN